MRAFLGLGSNLGDRLLLLRQGAEAIGRLGPLGQVTARSQVYETPPAGGPQQPDYLNAAVVLETALSPQALMQGLLGIEAELGRVRPPGQRDMPRTLDLDILLLGDRGESVLKGPGLIVPHQRLHQRTFALLPLLDVGPHLVHPVLGLPLRELYEALVRGGTAPPRLIGPL